MGTIKKTAEKAAHRSALYVIAKIVGMVFASVFGWIGDLWWLVKGPSANESPFERMAQSFSYATWIAIPAAALYFSGAIAALPLGIAGLDYHVILPLILFMSFVVTIHRCAVVGIPLRPRAFARVWRIWIPGPLVWAALLIAGIASPVVFALLDLPGARTSLWVAYAAWLFASHYVSLRASRHHVEDRRLTATHGSALATVFRTSVSSFDDASEMHMEGEALVISPAPPAATSKREDVEAALATTMPAWELDADRTNHARLVLVPTSMATGDRRAALADSAGLLTASLPSEDNASPTKTKTVKLPAGASLDSVEAHAKFHAQVAKRVGAGWHVQEVKEGKAVLVAGGLVDPRPGASVWKFADGTGEKEAAVKAGARAERMGLSLVEWDFDRRRAVVANTLPVVRALRARLASHLNCQTHELELALTFATNTEGRGILESVQILRMAKGPTGDQEKRIAYWLDVARTVVGGSGWKVSEDAHAGRVTLIHGVPRVLPAVVPAASVLPAQKDSKDWATFGIGQSATGKPVTVNLKAGPHMLCVGGTGSGKTVAMRAVILNALAKGFEVIIIDPTKKAAGLKGITSWTKGIFTDSVEQAAATMTAIYEEVRRRVDAIDAVHGENWRDLPAGSVKPWLVIVDEYASLVEVDKKPVGLPAESPEMEEWNRHAAAAAMISSRTGKIAREARSAGVHLLLGVQRPDASVIGGAVRENLGTILQMVVPSRPPSPEALGMVFPSEYKAAAMEEVSELNDGRSPGFALSYTEGGALEGFRVAFVDKDDMAAYAENLNIPRGLPLTLPYFESGDGGSHSGRSYGVKSISQPAIVDLPAMELDFSDLEMTPDDSTTPLPAPNPFTEAVPVSLAKVGVEEPDWDAPPVKKEAVVSQQMGEFAEDDPFAE